MGTDKAMAEQLVNVVLKDLTDRRGFRQVWADLDDEMRAEIRAELFEKVDHKLYSMLGEQGAKPPPIRQRAVDVLLEIAECSGGLVTPQDRIAASRAVLELAR
jgi:hypothetical protein